MRRVELARRAEKDVRRLDAPSRERLRRALARLARADEGLDIKPLTGNRPWERLRVGDHRILFRRYDPGTSTEFILIARIIDRSELDRAVRSL